MTQLQKTTALVAGALAIGLGLSFGASAGDKADRPALPSFSEIDENSDQLISREEIEAAMLAAGRAQRARVRDGGDRPDRFAYADSDGDGYLNESEFAAVREKMEERRARFRKLHDCVGEDESV